VYPTFRRNMPPSSSTVQAKGYAFLRHFESHTPCDAVSRRINFTGHFLRRNVQQQDFAVAVMNPQVQQQGSVHQCIIGVHQEYPPRGPCCTRTHAHTQVPRLRSSACPTYFIEQCKPCQQTAYHCHFITTAQIQSTRLYEAFFAFLMPHTSQYTSKWVANGQQHHVQICYTEFHRNPT
jgi:hypothetical protein